MNRRRYRDLWLCLTLLCALAAILSAVVVVLPFAVSERDRILGRLLDPARLLADPVLPDPADRDLLFLASPVVLGFLARRFHRLYQQSLGEPLLSPDDPPSASDRHLPDPPAPR